LVSDIPAGDGKLVNLFYGVWDSFSEFELRKLGRSPPLFQRDLHREDGQNEIFFLVTELKFKEEVAIVTFTKGIFINFPGTKFYMLTLL
jgi:hypothetical protein